MPYIVLEHSDNLSNAIQAQGVLQSVHDTVFASGLFQSMQIKSRINVASNFLVGDKGKDGTFVRVTINLVSGRPIEKRRAISQAVRDRLAQDLPNIDLITVVILEVEKETFSFYPERN